MTPRNDALFPHDQMRPIQEELVNLIQEEVNKKKSLVVHAPTGLGKTAASLAPALEYALRENKTVFFLTSRNTQHKIAIQTLQAIKEKYGKKILSSDIVGKKWMCIQPGVGLLNTNEFNEYCRALREEKRCSFYEDLKKGESLTPQAKLALKELIDMSPVAVEKIVEIGEEHELCPYELGMLLAAQANVVIADYYYLFHPRIRETFLKKSGKIVEDSIIIVDEGHNLPNRIKDLSSETITSSTLHRAANEAKKYDYEELQEIFEKMEKLLPSLISMQEDESYVKKEDFINAVSDIAQYEQLVKECQDVGDNIREEQKSSSIGGIGNFLDAWLGGDEGFTRIISRKSRGKQEFIQLSYRCLDPSLIAKDILTRAHSVIMMSGTLTPTDMYVQLLGFPPKETQEKVFPSPFPPDNRLNLIIAKTSTKYTSRSEEQYKNIAITLTEIINAVPGNSAVFFPSYFIKDEVDKYLNKIEKTVFHERQELTKQDREDLLARFRSYKNTGASLLAVTGGSFGEGIDLPGDELKAVVVVGLPLNRPDLETKALIDYYDKKFGKGWDYGYVFPAFNRVIQSAGRCIRSETDKGVIVFLDERYTWHQYSRCFPSTWKMKVSINRYVDQIKKFFGTAGQTTLVDDI